MTTIRSLRANLDTFYNLNFRKYNLVNPYYIIDSSTNSLTWINYRHDEYFDNYPDYFNWVIDNGQFSLEIRGKGLIRVYFKLVDEENLIASMSFLPNPDLYSTYFRFDMDKSRKADYIHSSYHVHFGYNNFAYRLPLFHYPWPSEFLLFSLFTVGLSEERKSLTERNFFENLDQLFESYDHSLSFKFNK